MVLTGSPLWSFTRGCEARLSISICIWVFVASAGPAANLKFMGSICEHWPPRTSAREPDEKYVVSSERLVSTSRSTTIGYIP